MRCRGRLLVSGDQGLSGELAAGAVLAAHGAAGVTNTGEAEESAERDERRGDADPHVEGVNRCGLHRVGDRWAGDGGVDVSERLAACVSHAAWAAGDSVRPASCWSRFAENWEEMTAPMAAIASRPPMRAIALLTPEAMPAFDSSASDSTVAVSGATVHASPIEKISSAGSRSVK